VGGCSDAATGVLVGDDLAEFFELAHDLPCAVLGDPCACGKCFHAGPCSAVSIVVGDCE